MTMRRGRGSGTVLMLGVLGAILSVLGGGLAVVTAVQTSTRARSAADLAALAAEYHAAERCGRSVRVGGSGGERRWCVRHCLRADW